MKSSQVIIAPPGLKGVLVADTKIGSVRGSEGFYHYREHEATELAATRSLESIWQLVVDGALPCAEQAEDFASRVGSARVLSAQTRELLPAIANSTSRPHLALIAALPSLLPQAQPTLDLSPKERRDDVLRIAAAFPSILATVNAIQQGRKVLRADPTLAHTEDWLRMATNSEPSDQQTRAAETYLSATIDHG